MIFRAGLAGAALCLIACLGNDDSPSGSPYDRARAKNESQRLKWEAKAPPYYQYTLSAKSDALGETYTGTCRLAPDTSYCDLKNGYGEPMNRDPRISRLFLQVDNAILVVPPGSLQMDDLFPEADLFLRKDSLAYFFTVSFTDSSRNPPVFSLPVGVEVAYDKVYGYPRSLRELPLGPSANLSGFTVLE